MENASKNKDTLRDLYALRAGLSVISQSADELASVQETIDKKMEEELEYRSWYLPSNTNSSWNTTVYGSEADKWVANGEHYQFDELEELKEKYGCEEIAERYDINNDGDMDEWTDRQEEKKKIAKRVFVEWLRTNEANEYFNRKNNSSLDYASYSKSKIKGLAPIFALGLLLAIVGFVITAVAFVQNAEVFIGLIGMALLVVGLILSIVFGKKVKRHRSSGSTGKFEAKKFVESAEELKECKSIIAQIDAKYEPTINKVKGVYDSLFATLKEDFETLVDVRDWKYVDVLIFYFETGRADNMKEALQLLEREIQTERIIGAIDMASKRICSAIKSAVNTISSQLSVISDQLAKTIALQETQNAQTQKLISAENMRNALIAKSNVTSEKLMQDVDYIKNYGIRA